MFNKQRILNVLAKVGLLFFGILIALALAEFAARLLGPPYEVGDGAHRSHQCDPIIGWRGVPNSSTTIEGQGDQHQLVLNSRGMHDGEHSFQKEDSVFRILMMGDSMVEAIEVAEPETSHQILEDALNVQASENLEFEVINGGVFAWGPPQPLVYFRAEGRLYDPDLVIVVWYPRNDLLDVLPNHVMTAGPEGGVHCFAPYFAICDGQFDPQPWYTAPGIPPAWQECSTSRRVVTNALSSIYYHSRLYQRLTALLLRVYEKETFTTNLYAPWLDFKREDKVLNYAYQLTNGVYAQLAAEAEQIGAKTALVIAPINEAVDFEVNPDRRKLILATEPILAEGDPTLPNKVMMELMAAQNVPVLDLHPRFVNYIKTGGEAIYWSDKAIHWNVAGNRLVGETIAAWLIEQGLVPGGE